MNKRTRVAGLVMSSVPKSCRDEFVKFAEEEFADNYASCFKFVWENFKLWQQFIQTQDLKLNYIIDQLELLKKPETPGNPDEPEIKTLSGRIIKSKRRENE